MLTTIAARDFKVFGERPGLDLSLSRLNVFLGQNNSGKTSAVDVAAVFVQTARDYRSISGLKWSGELVDLGPSGEHAIHNGIRNKPLVIALEIPAPADFTDSIRQQLGDGKATVDDARTIGYRVRFTPDTGYYTHEFLLNGTVLVRNLLQSLPRGGNRPLLEIRDCQNLGVEFAPMASTGSHIFNPDLFGAGNLDSNNDAHKLPLARTLMARTGIPIIREVLSQKVFFLGPTRGIQKGKLDEKFDIPNVGRYGQHTLQVLSAIFAMPEHRKAAVKIREWSDVFGLSDVSSGWVGGKELHSGYVDPRASIPLPLHSAGFGSQQILPVIVQLFASPEDSLVFIEEPEISLHPAAQVQLIRMFRDAVIAGRQVVITTHSQYLVMALQERDNLEIRPSDIGVYHFSREQDESKAERLSLDSEGILRGWIPSFADVERELLSSWMSRVHDKLKND